MNNIEIKKEINNVEVIASYNIYTKLQKLRKDFHQLDLKKSGENKYAGFKYFELKDFLPSAVELLEKYNLTTIMTTNSEGASLVLINCDNSSETITFSIPDAECQLKGCTDIQSLGGKITYQKRYLYVNLLDVCENDTLDAVTGKDIATKAVVGTYQTTGYKLSDKQVTRLIVLAKSAGISESEAKKQVAEVFKKNNLNDLTKEEYDRVCTGYIKKAEALKNK